MPAGRAPGAIFRKSSVAWLTLAAWAVLANKIASNATRPSSCFFMLSPIFRFLKYSGTSALTPRGPVTRLGKQRKCWNEMAFIVLFSTIKAIFASAKIG
jgi:hypothetical protein